MPRWIEKIVDFGGSPRIVRLVAGFLFLLLILLGSLQYHWIGQLSDAKRSEMQQALRTSAVRFISEYHRDLARVYASVLMTRPFSTADSMERHAERFRQWSSTALHPKLVRRMMIIEGDQLNVLNTDSGEFEKAAWPAELEPLREELKQLTAARRGEPSEGGGPGGPGGGGGGPGGFRMYGGGMLDSLTAMYSPRFHGEKDGDPPVLKGWSIVEFDDEYLRSELLADLANRTFGESYRVRIVSRADPTKQIFAGREAEHSSFEQPDLELAMMELAPGELGRSGGGGRGMGRDRDRDRDRDKDKMPPPRGAAGGGEDRAFTMGPGGPGGGPGTGPGGGGPGPGRGGKWLLQLKHEKGSLDVAVQTLRYKNLGIISGILLLMGVTIAGFVASTRRAQQLAQQQMEFVASISHELRTPLTVICSAGDNLSGGVVKNDAQVKRYGTLIRNEGRRLADMVEQILGYAGIQKGRLPASQPVELSSVVESAFRGSEQALNAKNCAVERHVEAGLPQVMGDAASLSHSIQNLITNAAKYGGESPWICVRAESAAGGGKVRITVEDRGPGIEPADLRHIFEPFYRGRKAIDDQIHGTGLGLSLVKRIIEAHNGRVSVESTVGKGTRFTLELPALAGVASTASISAATTAGPEANLT